MGVSLVKKKGNSLSVFFLQSLFSLSFKIEHTLQ